MEVDPPMNDPTNEITVVTPVSEHDLSGLLEVFTDLTKELHEERRYRREAEDERNKSSQAYKRATRQFLGTMLVIAVVLVIFAINSLNYRRSQQLIQSCVNPPKQASAPKHLTCYEKAQTNSGNFFKSLILAQDQLQKQREQELLDAINNHQTTINFGPLPPILLPPTTVPGTTTTTTTPKA